MRYFYIILLGLGVSLLMFAPAFAQNIPPGEEPGAGERRFEQDITRRQKALTAKPLKAPDIEVEEEPEKPVSKDDVSFVLKDIRIEGTTLFKPEDFKATCGEYLNRKVTFKDLEALTACIKSKYKEKGYLTTTAYVPEQEIRDGVLTIKVVEGKTGDLKTEGTKWFPSKLIKKYMHLKKNKLLNVIALERDIIRINKNPDLDVKTVVSPGSVPETSDVILKAKDYFPYHFGVGADNQGTRLVGKDRATISFRSSDMTGNNDSFFTSFLWSKHSDGQYVSYDFPADTYGTRMGVNFSHYYMRLGKEFKDLRITGNTSTVGGYITRELFLSGEAEGYLTVGLDAKSTRKHFDGLITANDQMRIPYFSFNFTKNDSWGSTSISPRFNFGTGSFLGASKEGYPTASRQNTGGYYFEYEQSLTRIQRMFLESYSIMRLQLQAATRTLAPSEQMQIGGMYSVRGYPEGDFLADTGAIFNFDWIFPLYFMPESVKLPYSDVPLRRQIEPVAFFDMGGGRINKAQPFELRDKFLASVGGGVRVRLYKNIFCRFEWAQEVGAKPTPNSAPSTFHFSVQTEI